MHVSALSALPSSYCAQVCAREGFQEGRVKIAEPCFFLLGC